MPLKDNIIEAAEVAQALGWTRPYFQRKRTELMLEHGMPSPLPGKRLCRWHRDGIDAWLKDYGTRRTHALMTDGKTDRVSIDRSRLHLAYVNPDMEQRA